MADRCFGRWTRTALAITAVAASHVTVHAPALAGETIVNSTDCQTSLVPALDPNVPSVFYLGNRLLIIRNNENRIFGIYCPLPSITGPSVASGDVTFAIVDGQSLNSVRLCFSTYYSDRLHCGSSGDRIGSSGYLVSPPSDMPANPIAPFIMVIARVTSENPTLLLRSITAFWNNP